jgi:phosphoribosylformylglycinamidine cyclo-ligase
LSGKFSEIPPIFSFIQRAGNISMEEMFRVFNMGIGFVIAVPDDSSLFPRVRAIANAAGYEAYALGHVTDDPGRQISLQPYGLCGRSGSFQGQ